MSSWFWHKAFLFSKLLRHSVICFLPLGSKDCLKFLIVQALKILLIISALLFQILLFPNQIISDYIRPDKLWLFDLCRKALCEAKQSLTVSTVSASSILSEREVVRDPLAELVWALFVPRKSASSLVGVRGHLPWPLSTVVSVLYSIHTAMKRAWGWLAVGPVLPSPLGF